MRLQAKLLFTVLLLVVGAILLLGVVVLQPQAEAQNANSRKRGEYTLVSGDQNVGNSNAIFIVDAANQELVVLDWDNQTGLVGLGYRDLNQDSQIRPGR